MSLAIVRRRREPVRDRRYSRFFRAILPLDFEPQNAPKPVDYSSFYAVGRDPYHVGRTKDVIIETAIPEKLSIAGWPFQTERERRAAQVMMAPGMSNPLQERVNITARGSMAYGDLTTLNGDAVQVPIEYYKLV